MDYDTVILPKGKDEIAAESRSALDELLCEGARTMHQQAIVNEVTEYVKRHEQLTDEHGRRLVVRNGHLAERHPVTSVGPVRLKQPRVRERREG